MADALAEEEQEQKKNGWKLEKKPAQGIRCM